MIRRCGRISLSGSLAYGGKPGFPLGSLPAANCTIASTRMLEEEPTPGGLVPGLSAQDTCACALVQAGKYHTAHKLTLMAHPGNGTRTGSPS